MLHIVFVYKDEYTDGEWKRQECIVRSKDECIELYGLEYCEYRFILVEEVK